MIRQMFEPQSARNSIIKGNNHGHLHRHDSINNDLQMRHRRSEDEKNVEDEFCDVSPIHNREEDQVDDYQEIYKQMLKLNNQQIGDDGLPPPVPVGTTFKL